MSKQRVRAVVAGLVLTMMARAQAADYLDLAPFGNITSWKDAERKEFVEHASFNKIDAKSACVGMTWDEDRDVREIRATFAQIDEKQAGEIQVQYWFRTWPPDPPQMPTIEDPQDDPWQGSWLTAKMQQTTHDNTCVFTFAPLDQKENRKADSLPGVTYRRTLKVRLLLPKESRPKIEKLAVFSQTTVEPLSVRIEFGANEKDAATWNGSLEVFNGAIQSVKPWQFEPSDSFEPPVSWKNVKPTTPKGVIVEILSAHPAPEGSNDMTVVTLRGEAKRGDEALPRTVSFNTLDLEHGPIFIPDFHIYVTNASDTQSFSASTDRATKKIREMIPLEAEQSYERATKEIPPLDPWLRQRGDKVYLPIAADASWQKFAIEYGGEVFIDKKATKAYGHELKRLKWDGDRIRFRWGTGEKPSYREDHKARESILEDALPIVFNRWEDDNFTYEQESFVTLLEGPLDPQDPARSEQTPAICMVRLSVKNKSQSSQTAKIQFNTEPVEILELNGHGLYAVSKTDSGNEKILRAVITPANPSEMPVLCAGYTGAENTAIRSSFNIGAGQEGTFTVRIPFVSDLDAAVAQKIEKLDYDREHERVVAYWRKIVDQTTQLKTPEPKFNQMARAVVPHIRISTTKDPKSGLYMVPAAAYGYRVYMNESCFQTQMLDNLGDTDLATQYLKTCTALQGSASFPGNYVKPHDGIFHGTKVDDDYDYTASGYGLDHGTILWSLAKHYFYTNDKKWLEDTAPHLLKAIEWIERQRKLTRNLDAHGEKVLEYGLLPAGHLEDNSDWGYWFSVNAYCVAGMLETAAALKEIGHPEAERIAKLANEYREALRTSVLRSTERAPVVRMRDGTYSPYVPTRAHQRFRYFGPLRVQFYNRYQKPDRPCYRLSATREVLYGAIILLNLQIFDPNAPMANWILDDWEDNVTMSSSGGFNVHGYVDDNLWFSQGGLVFQSNLQNPIWVYLYRHETPAAIRSIYNAFVACLYPDVNAFTEEYRQWKHASGPFYKSPDEARFVDRLRDMLVMESGKDLVLAGGAPRRWFTSPEGIQVDRLNTVFGSVAYSIKPGEKPNTLTVKVTPPSTRKPENIWLYLRLDRATVRAVRLPDEKLQFDAKAERVQLPHHNGPIELTVEYEPSEVKK